jgi:hypothetical protein
MRKSLILLFIVCFSVSAIAQTERLVVPWPENWKIGSEENTRTMSMSELIPNNEKIDNWTIIGTTTVSKDKENTPIESVMNVTFNQAKKNAINPTLTLIDKKEDGKNPWILFKIEAAEYKDSKTAESQLYYIIEGETALYSNFVAIKEASLSREFTDRWTRVFKLSRFVKQSK